MIYLILGPFGIFILFRILLPVYWSIEFLLTNLNHQYYEIVLFHLLYLLVEAFLISYLMIYIIRITKKYRKLRQNDDYIVSKNKEGNRYLLFSMIGISFFFLLNFNTLPIFMSGGSDAIVALGEQQKTKTWIMYGFLGMFLLLLLFSIIYIKNIKKKYFLGTILFISAISTGKKAALISIFNKLIFVYYLFLIYKPKLPIFKVFFVLLLSVFFIIYQFSRTSGIEFELLEIFQILFNLIYSSANSYLSQFIILDGVSYAQLYSNQLGDGGAFLYLFNPFLKFLFGIGIEKSIGPFLMYQFYGSEFPNGVNPTLFFEYIFVYGSFFAILPAFITLGLVFYFAKIFIKKTVYNFDKSLLLTVTYFGLFLSCLSFTADTLNTIRSLPFIVLPMFWFYFIKFLSIVSNKNK